MGNRSIILLLGLAFGIRFLSYDLKPVQKKDKAGNTSKQLKRIDWKPALLGVNLIGWGVLVLILSIMSDFQSTEQLALAFAWLILISSLFIGSAGMRALENILSLIPEQEGLKAS